VKEKFSEKKKTSRVGEMLLKGRRKIPETATPKEFRFSSEERGGGGLVCGHKKIDHSIAKEEGNKAIRLQGEK